MKTASLGIRPVRDVLFLTSGRTGSTLLLRILEQFRGVANAGEPLMNQVRSVSGTLGWKRARAMSRGSRWMAWALHPPHLVRNHVSDEGALIATLHGRGARLVTITRRNVVEQTLSALVRWTNNDRFHFSGDSETVGSRPLDPFAVLRNVTRIEAENQQVQEWAGLYDHVALVYEVHIAEPDALASTTELLRKYVGLPRTNAGVTLARRRTPLTDQIPNWDQVRRVLAAAGHEKHLEELT